MDLLRLLLFYKSPLLIFMAMVVESKVEWYITSDPVQIGSDLELFCNTTQNYCNNCTSRWNTGRKILAFGDKVIDSSKYAVSRKNEGFTLIIKNLTMDDIHRSYGCSYNFDIFTKNLTLPVTFEHQPTKDTTNGSHILKGRDLHLTCVFEKVHPQPICSLHLDEEDLSSKLTPTVSRRGICLNVKFEMKHTLKEDQTGGNLLLECSVGTRTGTYYDKYIGIDDRNPPWKTIIIACGFLLFLVMFIVSVMIFVKRHRRRKDKEFSARLDLNSLCILCSRERTHEYTNNKTVKESISTNEHTADAPICKRKNQIISSLKVAQKVQDGVDIGPRENEEELSTTLLNLLIQNEEYDNEPKPNHITSLLRKEAVGDEIVPWENEEEPSIPFLDQLSFIKEYENEPKPMNCSDCLSVPCGYMRSGSSGSSDMGIDCLARDRHKNCNNGTENDQNKLSITTDEDPSDQKKDHATLQINYENDVVQEDKSDSSALNENCENYHLQSNSDLPQT